jgi:hypothetical protein
MNKTQLKTEVLSLTAQLEEITNRYDKLKSGIVSFTVTEKVRVADFKYMKQKDIEVIKDKIRKEMSKLINQRVEVGEVEQGKNALTEHMIFMGHVHILK